MDDKIIAWLKNLYESNKILFYTVIPLMGVIVLVIKFREILINILVKSSRDTLKKAEDTDKTLDEQATKSKQQADDLVKQADSEPSNEGSVDPDWDKK